MRVRSGTTRPVGSPGNESVSEPIDVVTLGAQMEVIFEVVPKQLADFRSGRALRQPRPERREQAVVLVWDEIGHADGVPLIE
jgi:hypothetical protein